MCGRPPATGLWALPCPPLQSSALPTLTIGDAALPHKHYDPCWAHPLSTSSPATCSATGGPGTGNLQCVDIGDISTIALYKGIGATDPIPLSSYVGFDPHYNHFNTGTPAPLGFFYLAMSVIGSNVNATLADGPR